MPSDFSFNLHLLRARDEINEALGKRPQQQMQPMPQMPMQQPQMQPMSMQQPQTQPMSMQQPQMQPMSMQQPQQAASANMRMPFAKGGFAVR